MRTTAESLQKSDVLKDGAVVQCAPVDHDTYVSVVVKYANGAVRIRDFDKTLSLTITRPRGATWGPTGKGRLDEDDRANRAVDDYERQRGL